MKALIAAAAAAATIVMAGAPSLADPFAGEVQTATVVARVLGTDGRTHQVTIRAQRYTGVSATPDSAWVSVHLETCRGRRCAAAADYTKSIPASSFTVNSDASQGSITTKFAGAPLRILWTRPQAQFGFGAEVQGSLLLTQGGNATWSGRFLGVNCSGHGATLAIGAVASPEGAGPAYGSSDPKALPNGFRPASGATPRCTR
jgi:hypothetical protein